MSDAPAQNEQDKLNGSTVIERGEREGAEEAATEPAASAAGEDQAGGPAETGQIGTEEAGKTVTAVEIGHSAAGEAQQDGSKEDQNASLGAAHDTSGDGPGAGEPEDTHETKPSEPTTASTDVSQSLDASAAASSPALTHISLRPPSPSSRTSTPPLTGTIAPTAKKFSAINVNKKFLSKTGTTPSPSNASSTTKLNSLSTRPVTSPVPIAAPSSRLLSTKLTTVSSSKPSVSPQPPSSASTSSPWAKPSLPPSDPASSSATSALQPLSGNGKPKMPLNPYLNSSAPMGQGQGLGSAKPAWRAVNADGKRPAAGMSREFPTAREVAEGKKASETAAQAQAAQAAAILQNLEEEFTHLRDSAHRWDDDEDEDGIIDFGGDLTVHHPPAPAPPRQAAPAPRPEPPLDQPVSKSERFVEDFDRSWPRSARQAAEEMPRPPDLRKRESDRVLFNANSNRLEPPSSRPQLPQPTRLMSRTEPPTSSAPTHPPAAGGRDLHRQPPQHMPNPPAPGRQLPPHMADTAPSRPPPSSSTQPPGRSPWSTTTRDMDRPLPPHMANKPDLPHHSAAFEASRSPPAGPGSALPPRRSFGQATQPSMVQPPPPAPTHGAPAADPADSQAAEMHSAAEKARLRREAEEEERKAAAERAKQKARELEARLGLKGAPRSGATSVEASASPVPPPPMTSTPSYTIAQRPKSDASAPAPPSHPTTNGSTGPAVPNPARSPVRPTVQPARSRDDLWRSRDSIQPQTAVGAVGSADISPQSRTLVTRNRPNRPTAESYFDSNTTAAQSPPAPSVDLGEAGPSTRQPTDAEVQALFADNVGEQSSKNYMFDDTLARIKAAMGSSKAVDPVPAENLAVPEQTRRRASDTLPSKPVPQSAKATPPAPRPPIVPEFFDVTQPEIPRSPPPAWRTFVVKVPKQSTERSVIPQTHLTALRQTRPPARGWLMSFNPPLDLPQQSLSRTDMFLPPTGPRRVASRTDSAPMVSISQRGLEPFVKEGKSRPASGAARQADHAPVPVTTAAAGPSQTRSSGRWRKTDEPSPSVPEPVSTQVAVDLLDAPPAPAKAPAKPQPRPQSQARPPVDASNRFDGVTLGALAKGPAASASAPADADSKSGVRFMVSSELEGDSLLDEVNKMSLETVEEAGMKDQSKASGVEIMPPRSPVSHGGPSAPRTHPSSPNGNITWNTSHEHLKHVWQQTPQHGGESQTAGPSSNIPEPSTTPLYPSLNAPSTSDPPAPQSVATKLSYPSSQTFSPTSATFSSLRQQSPGAGYASPTSADGMSGLGYPRAQGAVNGYAGMAGQQNLWSTPFATPTAAYGAGYANASNKAGMDPKAAMAFNAAGGGAGSQYIYGQTGGYSSLPTAHSPYGQYSSHPVQAQQHQSQHARMTSSPNGTYNYPSYTQAQANRMSRFGQPNGATSGGGDYDNGGYYGFVGAGGQSAQPNQSHGMYYSSSGTAAVGHGAMHQRGGAGQGRKMW